MQYLIQLLTALIRVSKTCQPSQYNLQDSRLYWNWKSNIRVPLFLMLPTVNPSFIPHVSSGQLGSSVGQTKNWTRKQIKKEQSGNMYTILRYGKRFSRYSSRVCCKSVGSLRQAFVEQHISVQLRLSRMPLNSSRIKDHGTFGMFKSL